jgi:hypothetical protein
MKTSPSRAVFMKRAETPRVLALAVLAVAVLIFIAWGVRQLLCSRRRARASKL